MVGKTEGERDRERGGTLGKTTRRWQHIIENDREAVRGDLDWIDKAQGRNRY
jgi:hypothetical protein